MNMMIKGLSLEFAKAPEQRAAVAVNPGWMKVNMFTTFSLHLLIKVDCLSLTIFCINENNDKDGYGRIQRGYNTRGSVRAIVPNDCGWFLSPEQRKIH
jgi:hypothetical protein